MADVVEDGLKSLERVRVFRVKATSVRKAYSLSFVVLALFKLFAVRCL